MLGELWRKSLDQLHQWLISIEISKWEINHRELGLTLRIIIETLSLFCSKQEQSRVFQHNREVNIITVMDRQISSNSNNSLTNKMHSRLRSALIISSLIKCEISNRESIHIRSNSNRLLNRTVINRISSKINNNSSQTLLTISWIWQDLYWIIS